MLEHQPDNSRKNYNYNAYIYTDRTWHSHFHGNYELIFVMEGQMELSLEGENYTLDEGELFLVSPYTVHGFVVPADTHVWVGVFSDEYVSAFAATYAQLQFSKFRCDGATEQLLREKLFFQGQPDHFLCMALLYTVCHACVLGATPIRERGDHKLMREIIGYISENLDGDLKLGDLARQLGYEYHYFSAVFHQCFGMDFKKFVNLFRFERACTLLIGEDRDITEIYRECGFSGIRNFNRVFKQQSGCTPTEYRRRELEKQKATQKKP